jgi:YaiO family outer membrane protein
MRLVGRAALGLTLALLAAGGYARAEAAATDPEEAGAKPAAVSDPVTEARSLATSGQRPEALKMLQDRLSKAPDDNAARTLYGTVLSWEGRYDEAREELSRVLKSRPDQGDALPALLNVELWSGHPEKAETLARDALKRSPGNPTLSLFLARALKEQNRRDEARAVIDQVLEKDPGNDEARNLWRTVQGPYDWYVAYGYVRDDFTDDTFDWRESRFELKRRIGRASLIGRWNHSERFGTTDDQYEVDSYPSFRPGTYAYFNAGYSPDSPSTDLYPHYRAGAELFQSFTHGWEGSLGLRWLKFTDSVNIYTASVSKYRGNWLYMLRTYVTPDSVGTSASYHATVRRYFGAETYLGARYARGSSVEAKSINVNDTEVVDSETVEGQADILITPRWELSLRVGHSREERANLDDLKDTYVTSRVAYRF